MVASLALGACGKDEADNKAAPGGGAAKSAAPPAQDPAVPDKSGTVPTDDPAMAKARQMFAMQCQHCHGPRGRGDGPMGAQMNPRPRDYSNKEWQQSITDERIAEVIVKGGQGTGLNPMMPATPSLASQPELLNAMVKLIRSFGSE